MGIQSRSHTIVNNAPVVLERDELECNYFAHAHYNDVGVAEYYLL